MAIRLTGKEVAQALTEHTRQQADALRQQGVEPTLAIIRAGEDPSDLSYERGALKRAEKTGVCVRQIVHDPDVSEEILLREIDRLNQDDGVHGVLILRPLPARINDEKVRAALLPAKDIDGITEGSLAGVFTGSHEGYAPCTARACMELLDYYGIELSGRKAAVLGRSLVVGRPVAMMMMEKNATVTICHSRTGAENMAAVSRDSEIVIAAVGRAGIVDERYLRAGQIVLDVGINVDAAGNLCGDVDREAGETAGMLTPVPGGIGAVTTAVLMLQTVEAAAAQTAARPADEQPETEAAQ